MTLRSTSIWLPTVLSLTVVAIIVALEVVFCGTAVGPKSAKKGAYYAGPGNRFWSVLADSGLTPTCLDPSDYASLPQHGIGLTDLVKTKAALDADMVRMTRAPGMGAYLLLDARDRSGVACRCW
jgi:TDG/mug DNA glycosylase family protein